jgi:hypothetical protein
MKAGDTVYIVNRYRAEVVTVKKVGTKWAYINDNMRFDKTTLACDWPDMAIYRSEKDYDRRMIRNQQWKVIRDYITQRYHAPPGDIDLGQIITLLGIPQ